MGNSTSGLGLVSGDIDEKIDPFVSLGTTGLKEHSGVIDEEFLHRLRGMNGVRLYKEMGDNSPVLATAMFVIKMLIRQVDWTIEPADESPEALVEKEFVEGALEDMSHTFEDFISEALSFIQYGWSYFEVVWKIRRGETKDKSTRSKFDDGKWGWRKIEIRAQETLSRWVFDEEDQNDLLGMVQMDQWKATGGPVFIPFEKALLFRTETFKGNPEGRSFFRPAVLPYWYCKRISEFEATGAERDLTGMPIMEVPIEMLVADASPAQRALREQLSQFVTQVKRDERFGGLVPTELNKEGKPTGFKFKLLTSGGKRAIETDAIIKRYETRMLMLFLAQFLVMGTDKVGSLALSSNMTDLFATAIGTIMDAIASTFNRFAIRKLQEMNGRPQELDPKLAHGDIEGPDLSELSSYIASLSSAGMIESTPTLEKKLLELGNLPALEQEQPDVPVLDPDTLETARRTVFSTEQVTTILTINDAMKNGLGRDAATNTLALALGVTLEEATQFLTEEEAIAGEPEPGAPAETLETDAGVLNGLASAANAIAEDEESGDDEELEE